MNGGDTHLALNARSLSVKWLIAYPLNLVTVELLQAGPRGRRVEPWLKPRDLSKVDGNTAVKGIGNY